VEPVAGSTPRRRGSDPHAVDCRRRRDERVAPQRDARAVPPRRRDEEDLVGADQRVRDLEAERVRVVVGDRDPQRAALAADAVDADVIGLAHRHQDAGPLVDEGPSAAAGRVAQRDGRRVLDVRRAPVRERVGGGDDRERVGSVVERRVVEDRDAEEDVVLRGHVHVVERDAFVVVPATATTTAAASAAGEEREGTGRAEGGGREAAPGGRRVRVRGERGGKERGEFHRGHSVGFTRLHRNRCPSMTPAPTGPRVPPGESAPRCGSSVGGPDVRTRWAADLVRGAVDAGRDRMRGTARPAGRRALRPPRSHSPIHAAGRCRPSMGGCAPARGSQASGPRIVRSRAVAGSGPGRRLDRRPTT
jgi:hypothetical protein